MQAGFYTIMAAVLRRSPTMRCWWPPSRCCDLDSPAWMTPSLKRCFVVSKRPPCPLVGAFADSSRGPRDADHEWHQIVGCGLMLFGVTASAYAVVGLLGLPPIRQPGGA
jgi:hypothetical protein